MPEEWTGDPKRCRQAAVPKDVTFATKIALANRMVERVAFSMPEIRKLLLTLLWTAVSEDDKVLAWSAWRPRHQLRARESTTGNAKLSHPIEPL